MKRFKLKLKDVFTLIELLLGVALFIVVLMS